MLSEASVDFPDPGASLALINAINSIYGLGIETQELKESVERLNKELSALAEQYQKMQQGATGERHQLYG